MRGIPSARAGSDEYVLVVNVSVHESSIEAGDARRLLAAQRTTWSSDEPVVLVLPPKDSAPMNWILDRILGMPESAYRRHLLGQVFRGAARSPVNTTTLADTRAQVIARRGSLSALPVSQLGPGLHALALK